MKPIPDPRRLLAKAQFPLRAPRVPQGVEAPDLVDRTGANFDTDWARTFPARWVRTVLLESVVRPVVAVAAKPERFGQDRLAELAKSGEPVIFCANHHSHVDTPLLLSSLPEPWRYQVFVGAGADYFFRNRVSSTASALVLNAIPIDRQSVTRKTTRLAEDLLSEGWAMIIFPEGGRSPDGWGQSFNRGAAYLAQRTGAAIVPVHIAGTGRILRKGAKALTPGRTAVTFGHPMRLGADESTKSLAARVESAVAALADERTTDWYRARQRAHAEATPPLHGPDAPEWRRAWALSQPRKRERSSTTAGRWSR